MKYLTIDASHHVIVGVCDENMGVVEELSALRSPDSRHHVELLAPMVQTALQEAGIEKPEAIVVGTGPAAFTGLRAGLVTARTLARAWDIPLYGVSSAEVMALAGCDTGLNLVEGVIDARRKEVYALQARAMGADDVEILKEVRVLKPTDLVQELGEDRAIVACADENLYADVLPERVTVDCAPSVMVRLLLSRIARAEAGENITFDSEPQYLRRPDVHGGAHAQPAPTENPYGAAGK
ncbi:tRNA (adenosine(37)-N6)-threonylcarbamoyltransferase complex dimerization subunit type 1 TsaB [Arcanobacterium bovis]|uniref:tRNA (Adenosine(37)-N6)-threonylcarbamoyltransferase complex dimerization subunit type 1 TsaB n=1 Tax=Arcanobacterium bovis TaxID=2529275 RepID=A0A4Q9V0N2_9ACTO|nr:tRNA (adenosine(37)-N6)-threonylcarbamoyltransferase complex dimerization subunit type 1 TsaB [Arcanobacterium bovis]TBW22217.1 tRNA (adenosine(37)-N6)-threonylcarbamoyltransferase complex dimerization subunit type 1 TsaB [Arcanobacterium bovis]